MRIGRRCSLVDSRPFRHLYSSSKDTTPFREAKSRTRIELIGEFKIIIAYLPAGAQKFKSKTGHTCQRKKDQETDRILFLILLTCMSQVTVSDFGDLSSESEVYLF